MYTLYLGVFTYWATLKKMTSLVRHASKVDKLFSKLIVVFYIGWGALMKFNFRIDCSLYFRVHTVQTAYRFKQKTSPTMGCSFIRWIGFLYFLIHLIMSQPVTGPYQYNWHDQYTNVHVYVNGLTNQAYQTHGVYVTCKCNYLSCVTVNVYVHW